MVNGGWLRLQIAKQPFNPVYLLPAGYVYDMHGLLHTSLGADMWDVTKAIEALTEGSGFGRSLGNCSEQAEPQLDRFRGMHGTIEGIWLR